MKNYLFSLFLCFLSFVISAQVIGLQKNKIYEIQTKDGNTLIGLITQMQDNEITIDVNSLGEIKLLRSAIASFEEQKNDVELDKNGNIFDDHNSTYNIFAPTAHNLKKGQMYYKNSYLFFNSFSYGITDNFQVSAGFEIFSLLIPDTGTLPLMNVTTKFSIPTKNEKLKFGAGVSFFGIPNETSTIVGLTNVNATYGDRNNNFTVGTGLGFTFEGESSSEVFPLFIGGMKRLSQKISLTTDNIVFFVDGETLGLLSLGLRYHFKDNGSAFNFALYRPTDFEIGIIALPFVSVTIAIGKK